MLTMASKFRYVDDIVRAKSMVASGILGDLICSRKYLCHPCGHGSAWNSRPEISGGGVLIDNGTHSVDLMHYFLGPWPKCRLLEGKRTQGLAVEETVAVSVRSASGVICRVRPFLEHQQADRQLYGYLRYARRNLRRLEEVQVSGYSHGEWVEFGNGYDKVKAFCGQIENFSRAIRGEEALCITRGGRNRLGPDDRVGLRGAPPEPLEPGSARRFIPRSQRNI